MTTSQLVSRLSAFPHHSYKSQREYSRICLLWGQCPTPTLCLPISGCHTACMAHTPGCPSSSHPNSFSLPPCLPATYLVLSPMLLPVSSLAPPYFHVCSPPSLALLSPPARPQETCLSAGSPRKVHLVLWALSESPACGGGRGPGTGVAQCRGDPAQLQVPHRAKEA